MTRPLDPWRGCGASGGATRAGVTVRDGRLPVGVLADRGLPWWWWWSCSSANFPDDEDCVRDADSGYDNARPTGNKDMWMRSGANLLVDGHVIVERPSCCAPGKSD